ncbi:cholinesterase [Mollisia scopiformis]|uniref:Carboxylic ester hydrolase n=1 Tax=Mollisia scopiformis TaxID=149040 RepID=A0A194X456_MOLSC|nr:cholinesterase [Mollisia scopiformis]KUJ14597.1 cholinesterase [Mollisia scopiformis]
MFASVLFALVVASQVIRAVPSPNSLGSDLTILINNVILVHQLILALSRDSAADDCAALGEQLWSPPTATTNIQPNLDYLTYSSNYSSDQQYWIAPQNSTPRAIDGLGHIWDNSTLSPHSRLPAFCTQSAPFSNSSFQDPSRRWQVTVHSNNEYLTGFRDRLSFRFLGVRYAPQPKRFTYSTRYVGTGSNVSATSYGSECVQSGGGSEDCLFLNIWTPYLPAHGGAPASKLKPVMFWIHGGAFTGGTGNDPTFDGGNVVSRGDVVMVAINYQLSTLGFLALNDGVTKGNFGIADQINALDWVRKNIQDFGGDLDRITVFGQSAGAASVRALLASPKSVGKFQGAIPQSNLGGGGYGTTYSSWLSIDSEMTMAADAILSATNCSSAASQVDCLRAINASTLVSLPTVARYLVVDGTYLTSSELIVNGSANAALKGVHIMEGLMRDDGAAIISYVQTTNLTTSLNQDGFSAASIIPSDLFPQPTGTNTSLDVFNVTSRVGTDTIFRCIDQATAYSVMLNNVFAPDQYFYEFNRSYQTPGFDPNAPVCDAPKSAAYPNGDPNQEYFKCHSGELYFVFGNLWFNGLPLRDWNDLTFQQFVLDSWTSFARTYNPNPEPGLLTARGYTNTSMEIEVAGMWQPVKSGMEMRELEWPSYQTAFRDVEQCAALGWPITYYSG